jgi:hypothetical protein
MFAHPPKERERRTWATEREKARDTEKQHLVYKGSCKFDSFSYCFTQRANKCQKLKMQSQHVLVGSNE